MVVELNKMMKRIGKVRTDRIIPRIVQQFSSTEALAELVKNGNDQYEILHFEIRELSRIIVIFVAKGSEHDVLMVLDIGGGMTPAELAENWAEWGGDHQGDEGEGEQGLGGKAAMQKLAGKFTEFSTYKNGHLTTAGFYNKENGVFSELPEIEMIIGDTGEEEFSSVKFDDPKAALAKVLRAYEVDINQEWKTYNSDEAFEDDIPRLGLLDALDERGSFSLVAMVDIQEQIPRSGATKAQRKKHNTAVFDLMEKLESEGQMRRALNDSWVFFVHQHSPTYTTVSLLEESMPELLDSVEGVEIEMEGPFTDPETGRVFTPKQPCGLTLHASKIILTGKKWAKLKGIRVNDGRNSVWTEDVPPGNDSGAAQRIFGEFKVPSDELRGVATADRYKVPDIPSSRAIKEAMRPHLEEFRQKVADALRTSKTASRDTKKEQAELDARMADIERLIDLEALFDDGGDPTGGPVERRAPVLDRIYIENNEKLTETTVPMGSEFKLRFRPVGIVPGTELNRIDGSLEQLRGVRNLEPYFDMVSSDDSVVEVKEGFVIHALKNGNATVKISSTEFCSGEAEVELDITVVDLKEVKLTLDPAPGPRGLVSDLIIQAEGVDGTIFSHENGGFEFEVDGPGSLHSRFPPRIKTSKGDPADGEVIVRYSGGQASVLFSTTEEIHVPSSRGSDDGEKPGKKKFPTAILCGNGHGIPEEKVKQIPYSIPDTVNPDPGDITVKMEPLWSSLGIVWINTESAESRAKLRNPSSGFSYTENSQEWKKYIAEVAVEVAIQTVMTEMVRRGEHILSSAVTSAHELRREAERKLVVLYEAMAEGSLEV